MTEKINVIDVTTEQFETDVLQKSLQTPVLVDLWATWCGPCKVLGPILEKLAAEYNGAFVLAKIDVDKEQQIAAAFQVRSVPMVFLLKDGQVADGFQGALPEGQIRQFLQRNGIEPAPVETTEAPEVAAATLDPHAEVMRLRKALENEPENAELKLDLALALLKISAETEAEKLLEELPANLATDDRALRAQAYLKFAHVVKDAPPAEVLEAALSANPDDLRAHYLLGTQQLIAGRDAAALEHYLEMLRRDRTFDDGLPKRALIDAFRVIEDDDLIGAYRRKMSALLF
ncbi:MAG: thioredoxin [Xanthomonadaceae bacterium]|jgi:putative thioredoxin|nr:thioredoxin [Xanthomonadaceae bacterium]